MLCISNYLVLIIGLISDCIFQTLYVRLMTYNRFAKMAAIRHFYT